MAARERQRDVLRLRGVQNVLVLGHDELVDDSALPIVDGDLVGRDSGSGSGRAGRLLQLRGRGARPRGTGRPATRERQGRRGAREEVRASVASPPEAARPSVRSHASRGCGGARRHAGLRRTVAGERGRCAAGVRAPGATGWLGADKGKEEI